MTFEEKELPYYLDFKGIKTDISPLHGLNISFKQIIDMLENGVSVQSIKDTIKEKKLKEQQQWMDKHGYTWGHFDAIT